MSKLIVIATALVTAAGCAATTGETRLVSADPGYGKQTVSAGQGAIIPPGTDVRVRLTDGLDGRRIRPGQRFAAQVASPVLSTRGRVLVPEGATVVGHVAGIQPGGPNRPAAAALAFDYIAFRGTRQPLAATIVDTRIPGRGPEVRGRDVAIGAALGAIIGSIADVGEGTLVGAGVGAGAGTLVSLGRNMQEARLPAGSLMTIELQEPIEAYPGAERGYDYGGYGYDEQEYREYETYPEYDPYF